MIALDPSDPVPTFEQIRLQIGALIRSGSLPEGHKLPSIRQLAADLQTAPGTVARAYTALEAEGLINPSKTRGTRVCANQALPNSVAMAAATYLSQVPGLTLEEAIGAVRAQWETVRGKSVAPETRVQNALSVNPKPESG